MENVRRRILSRLRRGPATDIFLARWCDMHVRAVRPVIAAMLCESEIRDLSGRYALPFNPLSLAGPITIRGYRT